MEKRKGRGVTRFNPFRGEMFHVKSKRWKIKGLPASSAWIAGIFCLSLGACDRPDPSEKPTPSTTARRSHAQPAALFALGERRQLPADPEKLLAGGTVRERRALLQIAGWSGSRKAQHLLNLGLSDPDAEVQRWAAIGFGTLGARAGSGHLRALLLRAATTAEADLRASHLRALGSAGPPGFLHIAQTGLEHPNGRIREAACTAAAQYLEQRRGGDTKGLTQAVVSAAFRDPHPTESLSEQKQARRACLNALVASHPDSAATTLPMEQLAQLRSDPDPLVRGAACALSDFRSAIQCAQDPDWRVATRALSALERGPVAGQQQAILALLRNVVSEKGALGPGDLHTLRAALSVPRETLEPLTPALTEAFYASGSHRDVACTLVQSFQSEDLNGPDGCSNKALGRLLQLAGQLPNPVVEATLIRELPERSDPERLVIVQHHGHQLRTQTLAPMLNAAEPRLRAATMRALAQRDPSPELGSLLLRVGTPSTPIESYHWLNGVRHHQPVGGTEVLRLLSAQPIPALRGLALDILIQRGSPAATEGAAPVANPLTAETLEDAISHRWYVTFTTRHGSIEIELRPDLAPATVARFLAWAQTPGHARVIRTDHGRSVTWLPEPYDEQTTFRSEWSDAALEAGTLALREVSRDVASGAFEILLQPDPARRGTRTVFGKVTSSLAPLLRATHGDRATDASVQKAR